jgi:transposase
MELYSKDLRFRVLAAVDRGMARKEVARTFDVPEPTIRRYLRLRRRTGGVDPKPPAGPPPRKGAMLDDALPAQVSRNPDLTLEEHREPFKDERGVAVCVCSISRVFGRLGLPLEKSTSRPPSATKRNGRSGAGGQANAAHACWCSWTSAGRRPP